MARGFFDNGSTEPIDVLVGTGGDWYCDICNLFQSTTSIIGDPAQRQAHMKDASDSSMTSITVICPLSPM